MAQRLNCRDIGLGMWLMKRLLPWHYYLMLSLM
jgi:hypothetical protein